MAGIHTPVRPILSERCGVDLARVSLVTLSAVPATDAVVLIGLLRKLGRREHEEVDADAAIPVSRKPDNSPKNILSVEVKRLDAW